MPTTTKKLHLLLFRGVAGDFELRGSEGGSGRLQMMKRLVFYAWNLSMAKVELLQAEANSWEVMGVAQGGSKRGRGRGSGSRPRALLMHYECESVKLMTERVD